MEAVWNKIELQKHLVVNIYIAYEISRSFSISDYPTPEKCLFGAFSLTKNTDIDKYKYYGYGIGFDRHGLCSNPSGGTGGNVIIFGVDMNSSTKIDNRKKNFDFGKTSLHKD